MDEANIPQEHALLDRLSVAIQAAGLSCWEYSYLEERFTWFDNLPPRMELRGSQVEADQLAIQASILPEDNLAIRELARRAIAAGEEAICSIVRRRNAQGDILHVRVYQRFIRDSNGNAVRAVGSARDVTAEVAAAKTLEQQAEKLQEQQRRLDRVSASILEGHWETDLRTGKHWTSKSYFALLGYPNDSAVVDTLQKARDIVHPEDLEATELATRRHLAGGQPFDVEVRLRTKDGGYRWFRMRGFGEFDADGHPIRVSGSVNDIHKQRLAEDALREAQARFARAMHGAQDGHWEIEAATGRLWLSPRLSELLGFNDGELGDRVGALRARGHPEDQASMEAAVRVAIKEAAPIDVEVRMKTKAGEFRWYRLRGAPATNSAGQVWRLSGSMQDVTEGRLARDGMVRATAEAQAANRAKGEFLANVSHEIRTPMNGIIGMTRLLLDTTLDSLQRDYADTIRSSADSLLTIINDILDFSKIEAGKLDIESLDMDLHDNVEEIGSVMAFQAAARNLELIVNVHPDVPRHVFGDPQRIRQCLINLIGNAVKFTRSGEIVCEVSTVSRDADCARVRFSVRDTGIGIAPDALGSLFEPFVQADSSTTRHFGGTGLGLSIVRSLVGIMGGEIGVESKLGRGSTFWFVLPMKIVAAWIDVDLSPRASAGRRVLVVDDNETNRRVFLTQLSHAGYDVTLASSGKDALATLHSATDIGRHFDVVLADFQMPDMDGAMLGERINADPQLSQARVVLLTSLDLRGDSRRFAALGFAGYLSKPVRPRELLACLDKALSRDAEDWHTQTHPIITLNVAQQISMATKLSGKVLVVEDNVVNQKVARRFLERMGCEVTVAENGLEGVQAFEQDTFRLVLMDVQMPFMDGYAATRRIRSLEVAPGRTPIVALTANAMAGQLEKCIEAGMDALLTKPLSVEALEEMLLRFGLATNPQQPAGTREESTPDRIVSPRPVDLGALGEMTGGDADFAADIVRSYLDNSRELLAEIRSCLDRDDRRQLARVVHQLAGASANVQAAPLRELCLNLEQAAAAAGAAELERSIARISGELRRVSDALLQVGRLSGAAAS